MARHVGAQLWRAGGTRWWQGSGVSSVLQCHVGGSSGVPSQGNVWWQGVGMPSLLRFDVWWQGIDVLWCGKALVRQCATV